MSTFEIAWPRKRVEWKGRPSDCWFIEAVLTERRLIDGKPQMQLIARLACIDEEHANENGSVAAREKFWSHAQARLGRLYRLTDRDLDEIEAQLAERIPRPVPSAAAIASRGAVTCG